MPAARPSVDDRDEAVRQLQPIERGRSLFRDAFQRRVWERPGYRCREKQEVANGCSQRELPLSTSFSQNR